MNQLTINNNSEKKHACCYCGELRTDEQLNGYDPITGDYSSAHCIRLVDCDSPESDRIWAKLMMATGR